MILKTFIPSDKFGIQCFRLVPSNILASRVYLTMHTCMVRARQSGIKESTYKRVYIWSHYRAIIKQQYLLKTDVTKFSCQGHGMTSFNNKN